MTNQQIYFEFADVVADLTPSVLDLINKKLNHKWNIELIDSFPQHVVMDMDIVEWNSYIRELLESDESIASVEEDTDKILHQLVREGNTLHLLTTIQKSHIPYIQNWCKRRWIDFDSIFYKNTSRYPIPKSLKKSATLVTHDPSIFNAITFPRHTIIFRRPWNRHIQSSTDPKKRITVCETWNEIYQAIYT